MKPPISIVPDQVSRDTETALEQLLDMARKKQLKGICFGALVVGPKGRRAFTNATGEMHRSPIWALGVTVVLLLSLWTLSRGQVPEGWEP